MEKKPLTLFEHLSGITDKKTSWDSLTDADRKSWSSFMVNRFLSMNMDLIETVNELQKYTIGILEPKETYKLYLEVLPKKKQFNKYIKSKSEASYTTELIDIFVKYFELSESEVIDYLDILYHTNKKDTVKNIVKMYGFTEKEVDRITKIK
jgi:hypothetical protein